MHNDTEAQFELSGRTTANRLPQLPAVFSATRAEGRSIRTISLLVGWMVAPPAASIPLGLLLVFAVGEGAD
jgi:hypothetical protein